MDESNPIEVKRGKLRDLAREAALEDLNGLAARAHVSQVALAALVAGDTRKYEARDVTAIAIALSRPDLDFTPVAGPGRVLVCGADSGWLGWPGEITTVIPYPGGIHDLDPQDMGVFGDVRVYSIRRPS